VTERRHDMQRLRANEKTLMAQHAALDASLDSMSYGFCLWNRDLQLDLWNEQYLKIYSLPETAVRRGATLNETFLSTTEAGHFIGRTARELTEFYRRQLSELDAGGTLVTEETLGNGRVIKITHRRAPDMSFVATHEDVTEERDRVNALRQREGELQLQNMRFTAAVNNMSQGLCMFDREGRLVICNKRYAPVPRWNRFSTTASPTASSL
jgi:PAS domain-containing protein